MNAAVLVFLVIGISLISLISQSHFAVRAFGDDTDKEQEQHSDSKQIDESSITSRAKPIDDIAMAYENSFLIINVLYNDRKEIFGHEEPITISSLTEPSFGTVTTNSDNTITYMPYEQRLPAGMIASDSFEYFAVVYNKSGSDLSYNAAVSIRIMQTNDVPIATGSNYTVLVNRTFSSQLQGYDQDGDNLVFSLLSHPRLGEIGYFDPYSGRFDYTPHVDSAAEDSFTYEVFDGQSTSTAGTIRLAVLEPSNESDMTDHSEADQESAYVDDNYAIEKDSSLSSEDSNENSSASSNVTDGSKPFAKANTVSKAVIAGEVVVIDAVGSYDPDGDRLKYAWSQTNGPKIMLSGSNLAVASFIAPSVSSSTAISLRLIVSDGKEVSDPAFTTVTISPIPRLGIDILPGVYPNEINTNRDKETISVAILGSDTVDVSEIDQDAISFGPNAASAKYFEVKDADADGLVDLVGYFNIGDLGLNSSTTESCLTASILLSSKTISVSDCDSVKIINKNNG